MKTAEAWNLHEGCGDMGMPCACGQCQRIKQIQLDAMKEGMRRAAGLCDADFYEHNECRKTILTAAEQLTEKNLV